MSLGRLFGWGLVAIAFFFPVNWTILLVKGQIPPTTTAGEMVVAYVVALAIGTAISYFMVVSARGIKLRREREAHALALLREQPLQQVSPSQARLKPGEKAYGVIGAALQEMKTVGYAGGSTGISVRVAKGVTLRTSAMRGRPVKGAVITSNGELVVTDQRIIFAGDHKSFAIPLSNLLNTSKYSDGFGFNDSRASYTLMTGEGWNTAAFGVVLDKVLSTV